jgi:hypothetical protein
MQPKLEDAIEETALPSPVECHFEIERVCIQKQKQRSDNNTASLAQHSPRLTL